MSFQLSLKTYPALERSKKSLIHEGRNQSEIEYDDWHLPGQKDQKSDCGQWSYMGCLNKHEHPNGEIFLKPFQKSCFRADCEKCCFKWLGRSSSKSTKRMKLYEKQSKKIAKHIIISVPYWDYYKPKKEIAKKAYQVLKEVKADSGLIIFHPFRYHKDSDMWYYAPHFHVIGFGWVENVVETYQKYGYIIKNLGKRETLFGTIYYQLSHCGIKKHNHSLVYFGDCSYSKLIVEEEEQESKICPHCKEYLQELECNTNYNFKPDPNIMEAWFMAKSYEWFLGSPYQ